MIERTFEKSYPLTVTKATLTKIANRFIKDYKDTNGITYDEYLPEEIKAAAANIKAAEEVTFTDYDYTNTLPYSGDGFRLWDNTTRDKEYNFSACYDHDEYGEPTYSIFWYFFSNDRYKKVIGGIKYESNDMTLLAKKVYAALGKYRYFCTHRPPSCGCIPDGFVSYETYKCGSRYIGEATYNQKPSSEDLDKWGLVFDKNFEQERKAYLEAQNDSNNY